MVRVKVPLVGRKMVPVERAWPGPGPLPLGNWIGSGLMPQLVLDGAPLQVSVTPPESPLTEVRMTTKCALVSTATVCEVGSTSKAKSATLSVNCCVALGATPLLAVMVMT